MIRIKKPTVIPAILSGLGVATDAANRAAFDADPVNYLNGSKKIDILNTIYGHSTVKAPLKKAQHGKCCFCEKNQEDEFGNVEHYRPKKGIKGKRKQKLLKPGYFWVGYDWDNLYFVCSACNSAKYKGNLFPLVKESARARSHNASIAKENPLLIDPGKMHPRRHIKFIGQFPQGITKKGVETISICGLDRDALNGLRKKVLNAIDDNVVILTNKTTTIAQKAKAKKFLMECQNPESEFSSAAIDYFKTFPITLK